MAEKKLSILHISDLHYGQQFQWLWPNFKQNFLSDLQRLSQDAGPIDLVVFSGDLTQSGEQNQYDLLTNELKDIWEMWDKLGQRPHLFTVPGNHDLVRPLQTDARLKMLMRWEEDRDVTNELFGESRDNQYADLIRSSFANYQDWIKSAQTSGIPFTQLQEGLLPGDASASVEINDLKIGLMGLNSSFTQLGNGDLQGHLALDPRQANAVANGDIPRWCNQHDINLLVTHHPHAWLCSDSQRDFLSEIYQSGRFVAHFFGHMHESDMTTLYHGGDAGRRYLQAPSLFGMEYLVDGKTKRLHGYSIVQISLNENDITWTMWPRKGVLRRSGDRDLIPDHEGFSLEPGHEYLKEQISRHPATSAIVTRASTQFVDLASTVDLSMPRWDNVLQSTRYPLPAREQHLAIRPLERQSCLESIRQKKMAWVCADWGLGRDGFLWSITKQLGRDKQPVYRIQLGNYHSREEFLASFATLSGCSFQEFCKALAAVGPAILLLEDAPVSTGDQLAISLERDVEDLGKMISDFCPDIVIILLARTSPHEHLVDVVKLDPLDEADTRTYLFAHPDATEELKTSQAVSVIYRSTDGFPGNIDRTLKTLRVISLSELGPAHAVESTELAPPQESIPPSLIRAVSDLATSKDPAVKRAYLLLKFLALLPQGESVERLKRIDHKNPIFPKHAEELLDRDLIQVRSSTTFLGIQGDNEDRMKILVAPRPVRDYILTQMPAREIDLLIRKAISLYFGDEWYKGKASMGKLGEKLTSDDGSLMENPHSIVIRLLKNDETWASRDTALQVLNLCQMYCNALYQSERYRNCANVCQDVLSTVPETGYEVQRNAITSLLAKSLRMSGEHERAIPIFERLIEVEKSNDSKANLLLNYALCLESQDDQNAIDVAHQVIDLLPKSAHALHAESIIVEMEDGLDKKEKLLEIEKQARKLGHDVVANNLALARVGSDNDYKSLNLVHSTAVEGHDAYTAARAVVKLATLSLKESGSLTSPELIKLIGAYQYCYGERFRSLFNQSHEALWSYFKEKKDVKNLLSLFRHSSFIWRLHDNESKEQIYIKQLADSARPILSTDIQAADKNTAYFLIRARRGKNEQEGKN
jgi:predicted MPP superfamily phosphohydrolase/tetratricopeptide (TPR) repeat protein